MTFGTAPVDLTRLSAHSSCGLILTIFHLDNDIHQPNMMYHRLRRLREADEKNVDMVIGIQFYLMRLTCSQAREGLKVIEKIPKHTYLQKLVTEDQEALKASEYLAEFKPHGAQEADFTKFRSIRDKLTFHYAADELPKWYQLELNEKARSEPTGRIYVPDNEHSPFPLRYGFVDELNMVILRKHILQTTGSDAEILDQALALTGGIVTRVMHITSAIALGVLRDFKPQGK